MAAKDVEGISVEKIAKFVRDNFYLRRCKRYVKVNLPNKPNSNDKGLLQLSDCVCGRSYEWHQKLPQMSPGNRIRDLNRASQWSFEEDTTLRPCDSFGKLHFVAGHGVDPSSISPGASAFYIRLPGKSEKQTFMEDVYNLMTSKQLWGLPNPHLIIEVAGTKPKKFTYVDKNVLDKFNDGITNAAKAASAWIITGGTNRGVMRLVGDAVAESRTAHTDTHRITCIGILPWGVINNREQLVNFAQIPIRENKTSARSFHVTNGHVAIDLRKSNNNEGPIPSEQLFANWTSRYVVEKHDACKDGIPLNPGHDCFLCIDNGREKLYGEEVAFRTDFLQFLSSKAIHGTGSSMKNTPVVLLVVGGAINTLTLVEQSISSQIQSDTNQDKVVAFADDQMTPSTSTTQASSHFPRPVVLLSGLLSGASDLLSFAYRISAPHTEKIENRSDQNKFSAGRNAPKESQFAADFDDRVRQHPAFEEMLAQAPGENRMEQEAKLLTSVKNCLKYRQMITVVNLLEDNRQPLDSAILDAIFKSEFGSPATMIELAQLWGRGDVAKQILREHDDNIRLSVDTKKALTRAILFGQTDFVRLFIDHGHVDLRSYLTISQMKTLYTEIFIECKGSAGNSSCIRLFRSLMMRKTREHELSNVSGSELLVIIGEIFANLLGCYVDNIYTNERFFTFSEVKAEINQPNAVSCINFETNIRDMFLLQLVLCRSNLAMYFFEAGHDFVGTALMATIFLKSLSKQAERLDMTDLAIAYSEHSKEWQKHTIDLLAMCYEQNPTICGRLLIRSQLTWQGLTILEMAYYGDRKRVMEQPAVQTSLSELWLGEIATFTRSGLIYLTLFPPMLPFLITRIRFEEPPSDDEVEGNSLQNGETDQKSSTKKAGDDKEQISARRLRAMKELSHQKKQAVRMLARPAYFQPNRPGRLSIFRAIYLLYSAPVAKYITHSVTLIMFLFLFSSFILHGVDGGTIPFIEGLLWFWCAVYFMEDVRQAAAQTNLSIAERLEDAFVNTWMISDLIGLLLVIISIVLRLALDEGNFIYPHTTYTAACVIYWLKSLRIFFVTEGIGPKVFTLFRMMKDVMFFLLIYVILLLSFSSPIYCLLYPDRKVESPAVFFALLLDISYERMWTIYSTTMDANRYQAEGTCRYYNPTTSAPILVQSEQRFKIERTNDFADDSLMLRMPVEQAFNASLDSFSGIVQTAFQAIGNSVQQQLPISQLCSARNLFAVFLYVVYLLLTNICLLNMLIAMFSHTVTKTMSSATRLWRFNIYRFLHEYYFRPVLPGPFMIFELIYRFGKKFGNLLRSKKSEEHNDLKDVYSSLSDYEYRRLEMFERSAVDILVSQMVTMNHVVDESGRVISKLHSVQDRLYAKIDGLESRVVDALEGISPISSSAGTWGQSGANKQVRPVL